MDGFVDRSAGDEVGNTGNTTSVKVPVKPNASKKKAPIFHRAVSFQPGVASAEGGADFQSDLAFHRSAGLGDLDKIKFYLNRKNASVSDVDCHGNTALFYACWHSKMEVISFLLQRMLTKAVNLQNHEGCTALHYSVARGKSHIPVIARLVEFGANIHVPNKNKLSPRDLVRAHPEFQNNKRIKVLFELAGVKRVSHLMLSKGPVSAARKERSRMTKELLTNPDNDEEQWANMEQVFRVLTHGTDIIGDDDVYRQYLKPEHLDRVFDFLGMRLTRDQMAEVMTLLDLNGDGRVTVQDFVDGMLSNDVESLDHKYAFDIPFHAFAKHNSTSVTADDYKVAEQQLGKVLCVENDFEINFIMKHFLLHGRERRHRAIKQQVIHRHKSDVDVADIDAATFEKAVKGSLNIRSLVLKMDAYLQADASVTGGSKATDTVTETPATKEKKLSRKSQSLHIPGSPPALYRATTTPVRHDELPTHHD